MKKHIGKIVAGTAIVGLLGVGGMIFGNSMYQKGREAERIDTALLEDFKRVYGVSFEGPMSDSAACHFGELSRAYVKGKVPEDANGYYNGIDALERAAMNGRNQRAVYEAQSRIN